MTKTQQRYLVIGNPIAHSKSPEIHSSFAKQTKIDMSYEKLLVEEGLFDKEVKGLFDEGVQGLNITLPFKVDAYHFADQLTRRARQAGAVNTLACQTDGTVLGDNTDGAGLVKDIRENLNWDIKQKKILVLGAGGAVRGVLGPLLAENPMALLIVNRTKEKALNLAKAFSKQGAVLGCGYDDLGSKPFDIIINGSSASLSGSLPPLPDTLINSETCCYDMAYGKEPTVFQRWGSEKGAKESVDGLGMLIEQAAEAFYVWQNIKPETQPIIDALRKNYRDKK